MASVGWEVSAGKRRGQTQGTDDWAPDFGYGGEGRFDSGLPHNLVLTN